MGLLERSFGQLKKEGIAVAEDLKEFTKDGLKAVFYNFHKPAKVTVYSNPDVKIESSLQEQEPFQVSVKSNMRLLVALDAAKYIMLPNMQKMGFHPKSSILTHSIDFLRSSYVRLTYFLDITRTTKVR